MKNLLYVFLVWLVLASGCDPCDNCGKPLVYTPSVELIFINNDSLAKVNEVIRFGNDSIDTLTMLRNDVNDTVRFLNDSSDALAELIEQGQTDLEDEKAGIDDAIAGFTDVLAGYTEDLDTLTAINEAWKQVRTTIESGKVKVDVIRLLENGRDTVYTDSMTSYPAPLIMNFNQTTYEIVIEGDSTYMLSFTYDTDEYIDETREIKLRAFHIEPVPVDITPGHAKFDSISDPICQTPDCFDHETLVYLYF